MDDGDDPSRIADRLSAIREKLARMRAEGRASLERLSASREAADDGRAAVRSREAAQRGEQPPPV
ncbi:MAG TPA: hypothetical protein VFL66_07695 [Gaiellaceae bacterium]|nr:hypothetical protein [Gaiellaceae bacterium]